MDAAPRSGWKAREAATTRFFVFADTVTARSYRARRKGRAGSESDSRPSRALCHRRSSSTLAYGTGRTTRQQEALGVLGVNLIYGAFYAYARPEELIGALMDELTRDRMEVDMVKILRASPSKSSTIG